MSKHTPGPWNRGYGNFVYQGEHPGPAINQRLIATCQPTTKTREDWDEVFANAKLIAASPDLLQAITTALAFIPDDAMVYSNGTYGDRIYVKDLARAAIAKAQGE